MCGLSGAMSVVAVAVVVSKFRCCSVSDDVLAGFRVVIRMVCQPFWWHVPMVTLMWRDGLRRKPAAMRDRSGTTSVVVVAAVVSVFSCCAGSDDVCAWCRVLLRMVSQPFWWHV
jgi:hypothetical protein